jgi:hypothetical protein
VGWNEFANAVASDAHGGVIFVSRDSGVGSYVTNNVQIHDNYFHDGNEDFIYIGDNVPIGDVTIANNIFKGGTSVNGAITFQNGTNNAYVYNNVFYQTGDPSQPMVWGTAAANLHFKNNIWYSQSAQPFFSLETYQGATASFDHDLFYNPGTTTTPPSASGITETSPRTGNPLFVNATGGDFHVQAGSPAINGGTSAVSGSVTRAYDGTPRPQGGAYDIGAFER